jgi:ribose transport system substrate-binding protein
MKRNILLAAAVTVPFLCLTALVRAEEPCSAYPTGTAEKIESVDLEKTFGAVPAPKKPLHFAYITKTLINEFWQDVAAGIKSGRPNTTSGSTCRLQKTSPRWSSN